MVDLVITDLQHAGDGRPGAGRAYPPAKLAEFGADPDGDQQIEHEPGWPQWNRPVCRRSATSPSSPQMIKRLIEQAITNREG